MRILVAILLCACHDTYVEWPACMCSRIPKRFTQRMKEDGRAYRDWRAGDMEVRVPLGRSGSGCSVPRGEGKKEPAVAERPPRGFSFSLSLSWIRHGIDQRAHHANLRMRRKHRLSWPSESSQACVGPLRWARVVGSSPMARLEGVGRFKPGDGKTDVTSQKAPNSISGPSRNARPNPHISIKHPFRQGAWERGHFRSRVLCDGAARARQALPGQSP